MSEAPVEPTATEPPAEDRPKVVPAHELAGERKARQAAERATQELQARLDQIEAAKLSDLERVQKQNESLAEKASAAEAKVLRLEIANEYHISKDDAEIFLTGKDVDTLTAQAKRLAELSTVEPGEPVTAPGPRADLSQGPKGAPPALNSDGLTEAINHKLGIG